MIHQSTIKISELLFLTPHAVFVIQNSLYFFRIGFFGGSEQESRQACVSPLIEIFQFSLFREPVRIPYSRVRCVKKDRNHHQHTKTCVVDFSERLKNIEHRHLYNSKDQLLRIGSHCLDKYRLSSSNLWPSYSNTPTNDEDAFNYSNGRLGHPVSPRRQRPGFA